MALDTGTAHGDALRFAHRINKAEGAARMAARAAAEAREAARTALYDAERRVTESDATAKARAAELRLFLRALANRAETEPHVQPSESTFDTATTYAATFGSCRVSVSSSSGRWSSKPQPEIVRAFLWDRSEPVEHSASDGREVYTSGRGTSDAAKIAEHVERAKAAAVEALRPLTGAEYLRARGIDPEAAPDPVALLDVQSFVTRRHDSWSGEPVAYWQVKWCATLRSTGEIVPGLEMRDGYDIAEARADLAAGKRYGATHEAKTAAYEAIGHPATDATEAEARAWADALAPEALALIVWRSL